MDWIFVSRVDLERAVSALWAAQSLTVGSSGCVRCRGWAGTTLPLATSLPPSHSQIQSRLQAHWCFSLLCSPKESFQMLTGQNCHFIFSLKLFLSRAFALAAQLLTPVLPPPSLILLLLLVCCTSGDPYHPHSCLDLLG